MYFLSNSTIPQLRNRLPKLLGNQMKLGIQLAISKLLQLVPEFYLQVLCILEYSISNTALAIAPATKPATNPGFSAMEYAI